MFDISLGEFVIIGAAAYALLGPAQLTAGAYTLGRSLGRAVGFINRSRDLLAKSVKEQSEITHNTALSRNLKDFEQFSQEVQNIYINPIQTVQSAMREAQYQSSSTMQKLPPMNNEKKKVPAENVNSIPNFPKRKTAKEKSLQMSGSELFAQILEEEKLLDEYAKLSQQETNSKKKT
eukprot:snap_masked-scaffold_4-processed-gene-7.38-mRNA-1 protein AED:1.00 eAED:1.00 QI:0/-1/0/0/-1/1/1/0/176